jgi:hypothetical protein
MFGAAGWDNVGRSFDGLQARLSRGRWTSDLFAARLVDDTAAATGSNDDFFLSYNRFAAAAGDRGLEAYVAYRSTPQTASTGISSFETSLGERLFASRGRWRIEEELVYQLGSRDGQDLRAYLATVQAYVELGGKTTLGAGCDLLSGDGDPSDGRESFFDVQRIFHTGHKFYGIMDRAEQVAGRAGLLDPYAALLGPGPHGGTTRLDVHFFRVLEADVLQNGAAASRGEANLGTEVDGVVTLPVAHAFKIEAGAALWFAGSRLEAAGATADSWWSYLQGVASF